MWSYIKAHTGQILMLALFAVIFAGVFALYHLEAEAVLYASILCALVGSVFFAVGYIRFFRRRWLLRSLRAGIALSVSELPEPMGPLEAEYQELLRLVQTDRTALAGRYDRLTKEQEDYYAAWAHQIKTPIAGMGLILQKEDTEVSRQLSAELLRVEQYVGMALAYPRLARGTSDYVVSMRPLELIVRQSVRKFAPLFIRKKISLDLSLLEGKVLTDEKWLCFIIEQLLDNALKYTPAGGTIRIFQEPEDILVIADSGIGIAPEDLPRVWDKGYTGLNGRTDKRATGIGLYLCRQALDRLNHRAEMTSVLGEGTTVRLYLGHKALEVE